MMVNAVPAAEGISQVFPPREILTQRKFDSKKDCKALFGSYVEASTDAIVTNDMKSRTHSCSALGPSGNWQGSTKCFDLSTRKVVTRRTVREFPMPDHIKKSVNKWGSQPCGKAYNSKVEFLNHTKDKFEWENDDIPTGEVTGEEPIYPNLIAEIPGIELETDFEDIENAVE